MEATELRELVAELNRTFDLHIAIREDIVDMPEGFTFAPLELTTEMIDVGMRYSWTAHTARDHLQAMWRDLLRIAPKPEGR